ncbi:MAG: type II toxin-antitoxin system RelE/ParE family toxin [Deltaproteobacteria bacterium]|nr:type II toxin-antitoxin system RelE/ParE family toxin [Deltaproteobacteria bacterium]
MRVHWTENAVKHLLGIYEYISQNSPFYAERMVDKLTKRSEQIAAFPMSGRKVPEYPGEDVASGTLPTCKLMNPIQAPAKRNAGEGRSENKHLAPAQVSGLFCLFGLPGMSRLFNDAKEGGNARKARQPGEG